MNYEKYLAVLSVLGVLLLQPLRKLKKRLRKLDVSYQNGNVTLKTELTTSSSKEGQRKED
jgi:hypothetical protein